MYFLMHSILVRFYRSNQNDDESKSGMVFEAAETLITMQKAQRMSIEYDQKQCDRPPLTEKINIIENIKLN